jgi:hypothetical protein
MPINNEFCLACEQNSDETPLIAVRYRGEALWICPQHLPILIHKPEQLAHKLPGMQNAAPPAAHEH